jgi:hypothetical protein
LATALPQTVEHLKLNVPLGWNPLSLLHTMDAEAWRVFPQLKRLYIRYPMLSIENLPFALTALEQYFQDTDVDFAYRLDFCFAHDIEYPCKCISPQTLELASNIFLGEFEERKEWLGPASVQLASNSRWFRVEDWPFTA